MKVLVLNANQRASLAVTRALGAAGCEVVTADSIDVALAGGSRFSMGYEICPSPENEHSAFLEWIDRQISTAATRERPFDAIVPITEVTTDIVVRNRERWPKVLIPFASIEQIDVLSDKVLLYERAIALGVPVPRSVVVRSMDDIPIAIASIGFPAILKPRRSRVLVDASWVDTAVKRVATQDELAETLCGNELGGFPFLFQEIVPGVGAGVFALYRQGLPLAFFSHVRLREKPPEGGVSVFSESCQLKPELKDAAKKLLDSCAWHGVAMVEFKNSDERGPFLMEVNARFWGSLQLAIDAGVNFPALAVMSDGEGCDLPAYRLGQRLRWWLGDLDRLYLIFKRRRSSGDFCRELWVFIKTTFVRQRNEVFRWSDPYPAIVELRQYLKTSFFK